jgi:hypothetical protein
MNARAQADQNRNGRNRGTARDLFEQSERVRDDLLALVEAATHLTRGWQALVRNRMEQRPYATLAAAAGVGYVLGGGVPTMLMRVLAGIGGRMAVERLFAEVVADHTTE